MKTKCIHIIDDDKVMLDILKHQLETIENVEIKTFSSAESCLNEMIEKPDLVILDFYLDSENAENINGHEALGILRDKFSDINFSFNNRVI